MVGQTWIVASGGEIFAGAVSGRRYREALQAAAQDSELVASLHAQVQSLTQQLSAARTQIATLTQQLAQREGELAATRQSLAKWRQLKFLYRSYGDTYNTCYVHTFVMPTSGWVTNTTASFPSEGRRNYISARPIPQLPNGDSSSRPNRRIAGARSRVPDADPPGPTPYVGYPVLGEVLTEVSPGSWQNLDPVDNGWAIGIEFEYDDGLHNRRRTQVLLVSEDQLQAAMQAGFSS